MLNKFVLWSKINYILLNIDKFKVIYFISKTDPILKQHKINDFSLSKINSIKDLETYFEIDLGFKMNHKIILNKSYKMLGFLYRNTNKFRNPLYALKLNTSLFRSNLEFGSIVRSQNPSTYYSELENFQNKFLKCLTYYRIVFSLET